MFSSPGVEVPTVLSRPSESAFGGQAIEFVEQHQNSPVDRARIAHASKKAQNPAIRAR